MRTRRLLLEGLFFAYWVVRRLFELLILFGRSERAKEVEIWCCGMSVRCCDASSLARACGRNGTQRLEHPPPPRHRARTETRERELGETSRASRGTSRGLKELVPGA